MSEPVLSAEAIVGHDRVGVQANRPPRRRATLTKQRHPRRRGSIVPRGDKTFLLRLYLHTDAAGKRVYKSETFRGSVALAAKRLAALEHLHAGGKLTGSTKATVAQHLDKWLEHCVKPPTREESTYAIYSERVGMYIKPTLGHVRLDKLTKPRVQEFYSTLAHLKPHTIHGIHRTLHTGLAAAVDWQLIPFNPATKAKLPRIAKKKRMEGAWAPDQVRLFLEKTGDNPYHALFAFRLLAGVRPQEAVAAQWADVDDKGVFHIQRAVKKQLRQPGKGQRYYIGEPKTDESKRQVVLPKYVLSALEVLKRRQAADMLRYGPNYQRDGYIFAGPRGGYLSLQTASQAWRRSVRTIEGLPYIDFEHARHTFGSAAHALGADIATISQAMGHSSIETTKDIYVSVGLEQQHELARRYDRLMGVVNG